MKIIATIPWIAVSIVIFRSVLGEDKVIEVVEDTGSTDDKSGGMGAPERRLYDETPDDMYDEGYDGDGFDEALEEQEQEYDGNEDGYLGNDPRSLSQTNQQDQDGRSLATNSKTGVKDSKTGKNDKNKKSNDVNKDSSKSSSKTTKDGKKVKKTEKSKGDDKGKFKRYKKDEIKPADCDLSVEVFPLYYTPVIRSSNFRLAFSSNCLPKRDINFEIYYRNQNTINAHHNPTIVNLELWGNHYNITYGRPRIIDPYDVLRSVEYQRANMTNFLNDRKYKLDLKYQNEIFLDPQIPNTFNRDTIDLLKETEGLVRCRLIEKKIRGWKLLKRIREASKRRMQTYNKEKEELDIRERKKYTKVSNPNQLTNKANERQLQETGFSFYKPPAYTEPEDTKEFDPDSHFPEEDLDQHLMGESEMASMRPGKLGKKDANSVWGFASRIKSDYYDEKGLPLKAKAPLKEMRRHKRRFKRIMRKKYIEEYRISCRITNE